MPNKLEQAQEALAKVEAHMETLTPQTQARHMAERVRDNLAACIAMAQGKYAGRTCWPPPRSTFPASARADPDSRMIHKPGVRRCGTFRACLFFWRNGGHLPRPLILPHPLRVV